MSISKPNANGILLDTSAINSIAKKTEYLNIALQLKQQGYHFYVIRVSENELNGFGAKVYDKKCFPSYFKGGPSPEEKAKIQYVEDALEVEFVPEAATLMHNHWILDGNERIEDGLYSDLIAEILSFRPKWRQEHPFSQFYDAQIAEAAAHYNLILITDDRQLRHAVNKYAKQKSISTAELSSLCRNN